MTRPLGIAVVAACPFPLGRGTPIRIMRLAEAMAQRGHRISLATYHLGDQRRHVPFDVHRTRNVPFYKDCGPGPSYTKFFLLDPLLCLCLRQVLRQQPIDVIHAHHYEGLAVALAARGRDGPPIVYDAHTMLDGELQFYRTILPAGIVRWSAQRLDLKLPIRADHIVTVTEDINKRLAAMGIPPERLSLVRNGVEAEGFEVAPATIAQRSDGPLLAFAGNLAPYQGVAVMLEAFRLVLHQQPGARLAIITDSPTEELRHQAAEAGVLAETIVIEAGFERVPALLRAADILVNPRAVCPGLPQKVLNYMVAGRAIVSFAGSGHALEHGRTGWLVEGDRADDFARGILAVAADAALARRLGENARAMAAREFTWSVSADRLEAAFAAVLARCRSPAPSSSRRAI